MPFTYLLLVYQDLLARRYPPCHHIKVCKTVVEALDMENNNIPSIEPAVEGMLSILSKVCVFIYIIEILLLRNGIKKPLSTFKYFLWL